MYVIIGWPLQERLHAVCFHLKALSLLLLIEQFQYIPNALYFSTCVWYIHCIEHNFLNQ